MTSFNWQTPGSFTGFGAPMGAFSGVDLSKFNLGDGSNGSLSGSISGFTGLDVTGPGAGSQGLFGQIGGLEGLGAIAKGLASLGSVYGAIRGLGLAEDQFDFTKQAYQTNLANQRKAYNTSLEDRIRSRYHTEGRGSGAVQSYLDKHSL